jgi:integrase
VALKKINKRTVDALDVPGKDDPDAYYWDVELKGFGVRVTRNGVRSYVVQYRMKGKPARRMTLGVHGAPWTPDKARDAAQAILIDVKKGVDPVANARRKLHEEKTLNFDGFLSYFRDECLKVEWRDSWEGAYRTLELHALPKLKGKALPHITPDDVAGVIDPLRDRKALARKVWAVLSRLFTFAIEDRKLAKAANPMDGVRAPGKPDNRKRVLSPDEIVAAWRASYKLNDPRGAFVRMLFCTLQRRCEVSNVPWKEFDRERAVWVIDAERAKNDEDHLLPLNAPAVRELEALGWKKRGPVFVSETGKTAISGFNSLKRQLDRHMLPILQELADKRAEALGEDLEPVELKRWTIHDLRRTGTTMMQSLGIPVEVADRCLNHRDDEASRGSRAPYFLWKYEPEKREAMRKWGDYLERLVAADGGNIVRLSA